jgi:glycogen(starch) synthase
VARPLAYSAASMALRVLIVARWYPSHDNPGRGSFVADLVEALTGEGAEVVVASWDDVKLLGPPAAVASNVARVTRLWSPAVSEPDAVNVPSSWGAPVPVARLPAVRVPNESMAQQVDGHAALLRPFGRALHARWPFDIVHAHTGLPDGLAALRLARAVARPLVVTEHDSSLRKRLADSPASRALYRQLVGEADRVFAVSEHFRSLLAASADFPETAVGVVPNPVPSAFFEQPLDEPRDMGELLYVGHRLESKGTPVLLEAFAIARMVRPDLRLRLVGRSVTAQDEERWHGMAATLGITAHVAFDPPTDRRGVARAMAHAGALVHPSPFETFGLVVAEALACGLPVVATRSGVEEILGEGGDLGELAAGTDSGSLSEAIVRFLERRSQFVPERLREAARSFEGPAIARRMIALYGDAAGSRPAGSEATMPPPPPGGTQAPFEAPMVVGLRRSIAAQRLAALPAALATRLTLVTEGAAAGAADMPALGQVIEISPEAEYRARLAALGHVPGARWSVLQRVRQFVRSPRTGLARRRLRRSRDASIVAAARRAVEDAWRSDPLAPSRLLPLEANDLLASEQALAAGAGVTPGSTRWLADRWDEADRRGDDRRGIPS